MSDKQQSLIARVLRTSMWAFVGLIVVLIYKMPVEPREVSAAELVYVPLIVVAVLVLVGMVYLHSRIVKGKLKVGHRLGSGLPIQPPLVFCVVIQGALAESIAFYGLIIHLIGGSRTKSLSFCLLSLLGFVMLEFWVPKYAELSKQSTDEETGRSL